MTDEKKKSIKLKYETSIGELQGFISLLQPSKDYRTYGTNVLIPKQEGEALAEQLKKMRQEQFILNGRKGELAKLPCEPYCKQDKETGEKTPDPQERYVIRTKLPEKNSRGELNLKPLIVNAKAQPITGNVKIGEGTKAIVHVCFSGYAVGGKVGIKAQLLGVQIIELVEYESATSISLSDFKVQEGFDGVGEDFTDNTPVAEAVEETEEEEF